MKTAVYYNNRDIRIRHAQKPAIKADEVLLKVASSGICGTDVIEWYRIHKAPLVLGHEVSGVIDKVGRKVKGFKKGQRVAVSHHVPCQKCYYCKNGHETACETIRSTNFYPGGFAQFIRVPKINVEKGVYKIPKNVSFDEATFTEPLACVLRGQRNAKIEKKDTVLVLGSGISGLLHIKLLKAKKVKKIFATDISEKRLKFAKKFGADFTILADKFKPDFVRKNNNGRLADKVVLCTGKASAIKQGFSSIERGGAILFFACTDKDVIVPLSINDVFWRNDITFTTSYAGSPSDHRQALKLIGSGRVRVKDMVTHVLPLEKAKHGFYLVQKGNDSVKVILRPN